MYLQTEKRKVESKNLPIQMMNLAMYLGSFYLETIQIRAASLELSCFESQWVIQTSHSETPRSNMVKYHLL